MNFRRIPNTNLDVSEISFGCMSLHPNEPKLARRMIHNAVDAGINLFDTADLYDVGRNEEMVGEALKENRDKVYIATKVGNKWREDLSGWDWTPTKEYIFEAVEKSLKRLQTDYIDLYQLHGGTIDDDFDEVFESFEMLKDQGKIRYYGISSIRPNVIREVIPNHNISTVMSQYSFLDRRPEEFVLPYLDEYKRGILVRGSLAKGLLINKPTRAYLDHSEDDVSKIQLLNQQNGNALSNALGFVLSNKTVSTAVIGIRTEEQLAEVIRAYNSIPSKLPNDLLSELPMYYYSAHR